MDAIDAIREEDVEPSLIKQIPLSFAKGNVILPMRAEKGYLRAAVAAVSYTHLTLPTNREV